MTTCLSKRIEANNTEQISVEPKEGVVTLPGTRYYTYPEVAEILRCSEKTIYNRVKAGELQTMRNGRLVLFSGQSIEEFLTQKHTAPK